MNGAGGTRGRVLASGERRARAAAAAAAAVSPAAARPPTARTSLRATLSTPAPAHMASYDDDSGEDWRQVAVESLKRIWRPAIAELVSTALLVLFGIAAALPRITEDNKLDPAPLAHIALAFGFVVIANAQVFGPVSGAHMNPAVTLAAVIAGQLSIAAALIYLLAQVIGATLGFGTLLALAPTDATKGSFGCTAPAKHVSDGAAAALEALLTALLALLACAVWTNERRGVHDPAVPIKFGLLVAGLIYSGGYLTGASINPVRSLGPAIFQNSWRAHWVYWVGPLCGAALAALVHRLVLAPTPPTPRAPSPRSLRQEQLPLNEKQEC